MDRKEQSSLGLLLSHQFYFNAKLTKMEYLLLQKPGFEKMYSLITLITGEIGDNSFAHNMESGRIRQESFRV